MRDDLLALTPEAITALSNAGLVKRAQREIQQGKGPTVVEADGMVTGTFPDGATTQLPPGKTLREAPCTCGAAGVCRHRVAVVLAYIAGQGQRPATAVTWSPGSVTDEALAVVVEASTLHEAQNERRRGLTVEVIYAKGDALPIARLPSCTVRFLVPGDVAWARCDCVRGQACAHVALAVWAFREGDARGGSDATIELADHPPAVTALPAVEAATALATRVLVTGVAQVGPAIAGELAVARRAVESEGLTWLSTLIDDLEELLGAHQARSARYSASEARRLTASIFARARAARGQGRLPARHVLGLGEAREVELDHLRLVSLGARIEADGRSRHARVVLADPDTATACVLEKSFEVADGEEMDGPAIGRRRVAGSTLTTLAHGQVVTRAARRRANRALLIGTGRAGMTSVSAQTGAWETLPSPLRAEGLDALVERWRDRPPALLRPRVLAEDVHVVPIGRVVEVMFHAATQELVAVCEDPQGAAFRVVRPFRNVAPHALDHLAAALAGKAGPPRFVAGEVRFRSGVEVDPLAIAADRVIVPDLEPDEPRTDVPRGSFRAAGDLVGDAVAAALSSLDELVHLGLRNGASKERLEAVSAGLRGVGMLSCADRMARLGAVLGAAGRSYDEAAVMWADAAMAFEVASELGS